MRLINAQTLNLELFTEPIPLDIPYAILSHTWGDEEVTFEDMRDLTIAKGKKGFAKIKGTCQMALSHGLQYAWLDTCCIDKSSSAELSEAINSMYRWYKDALMCFAFLDDLSVEQQPGASTELPDCRWFTRGWTLQELIAPKQLMFFDKDWKLRGTKEDLADVLEAITGIGRQVLTCKTPLSSTPLAKRMSWASKRQTTRVEDRAYSLLGLFDVNMPMIYGEGSRAFIRLQEEILKKTTDLSLFAWQARDRTAHRGMLARYPNEFYACGQIELSEDQFSFRDEIAMTNKGVKIKTALQYNGQDSYILDLHCYRVESNGGKTSIGIYLKRALDTYFRKVPQEIVQAVPLPGSTPRPIFLATAMDESLIASMITGEISRRISVSFPKDHVQCRVSDIRAVPETYWEGHERYFSISGLSRFQGFVRFRVTSRAAPIHANYGTSDSEESSQFILAMEMVRSTLRMNLYAETGLQSSPQPEGFIDPFEDIERYGALGDPFSLSVLSPADDEELLSVSMIHRNHRNNYVVSASLESSRPSPRFEITISLDQSGEYYELPHRSPLDVAVKPGEKRRHVFDPPYRPHTKRCTYRRVHTGIILCLGGP